MSASDRWAKDNADLAASTLGFKSAVGGDPLILYYFLREGWACSITNIEHYRADLTEAYGEGLTPLDATVAALEGVLG